MKKINTEEMVTKHEEICRLFYDRGLDPIVSRNNNNVYAYVNGIKVEWHSKDITMRLGYSNSEEDIQNIGGLVTNTFGSDKVNTLKNWVDIKPPLFEDFELLIAIIDDANLDLEKPATGRGSSGSNSGVLFEGSNFSNAHERMTTIGPRFMNLVCKATNMVLENMDAEWPIMDAGRIDGVEIDENGDPVAIYECQAGIQNGDYLDDEHLSKSLLRYPFDPAILPTLRKIVILAGGYSQEHLNIIKQQAGMFSARENPIELILLKTNRVEDKIGVEIVDC